MKKYLMTAMAAVAMGVAFTSCSHNTDLYGGEEGSGKINGRTAQEQIELDKAVYKAAFEKTFGKVAPTVDWGFGSGTRAFTRAQDQDYPATSHHINANGNEWAASTTGDNPKTYGGWLVPAPLTEGQIERVKAYFQANPNLKYEDPHWRHFFVQQVYKGGDDPKEGGSPENIVSASNKKTDSNSMTDLYVGPDKNESYYINNFGKGDAKPYPNVLNNGQDVNSGDHYSDKILLMVNVDNTSTFTYFNTTTSSAVNNKCALVAASVIDEWAAENGNPGAAVVDEWERSFLGFDLALLEGAQAYDKNGGNASYWQAPGQPTYYWDGTTIAQFTDNDRYITDKLGSAIGYLTNSTDWYVSAGSVKLNQTYNCGEKSIDELNWDDIKNAVVLDEMKVAGAQNGKAKVINMKRIKELVDEGYLPVKDRNLAEWVKVGKSDGYFTDWIVTLTRADRIDEKGKSTYRVIAEDLSATEGSDFDFNDVVFDVEPNETGDAAKIVLRAAGGIYRLTVAGQEVHQAFGATPDEEGLYPMINTQPWVSDNKVTLIESYEGNFSSDAAIRNTIKNIPILVYKPEYEENGAPLEANTGQASCKILVDQNFDVVPERKGMATEKKNFNKYVQGTWDTQTKGFWWKPNANN